MHRFALLLLGLSACATTTTAPKVEAPKKKVLPAPGPLASTWLVPGKIFSAKQQTEITEAQMFEGLAEARVVYVGEKHPSAADHALQLRVIDTLRQREPSIGIGLEMVKRPFQKWLSDYVEGRIEEAEFLEKVQWGQRWGFDFALYRPILEYARQHKLPVYALNARDELTRAVAREGLESLAEDDKRALVELDLQNEGHRKRIRKVFDDHGMGKDGPHGSMNFENFYAAQVIWDETMAHEVANELARDGAPKMIVVLAGTGHIRRGEGIPQRAARRGAKPFLSVYPLRATPEEAADALKENWGDFLWVMPEAED